MRLCISSRNAAVLYLPFVAYMLLYPKISLFREWAFILAVVPLILFFLTRAVLPKRFLFFFGYFLLRIVIMSSSMSLVACVKSAMQDIVTFMPIFIWEAIESIEQTNEKKRIAKVYVRLIELVVLLCIAGSIAYSRTDIYAIRSMANHEVMTGIAVAIGGGYPLIFALILLVPYWLTQNKQRLARSRYSSMKYVIFSLLALWLVVASNVTAAVVLILFGVILATVTKDKRSFVAVTLFFVGFILLLLPNEEAFSSIVSWCASFFDEDSVIYARLQEIGPALYSNDTDSSFGSRLILIQRSIGTFLKYPLTGIGMRVGYNYYNLAPYVGHHCEWVDLFAKHGAIVAICLIAFVASSIRKLMSTYSQEKGYHAIRIVVTLFWISGFVDPIINTNMMLFLFVYVPCHIEANRA